MIFKPTGFHGNSVTVKLTSSFSIIFYTCPYIWIGERSSINCTVSVHMESRSIGVATN